MEGVNTQDILCIKAQGVELQFIIVEPSKFTVERHNRIVERVAQLAETINEDV